MRSLLPFGIPIRRRIPIIVHTRAGLTRPPTAGLLWTEALYLAVIVVVAFIVANPFNLGFRQAGLTKHIGLVLTVPLVVVHLLARSLTLPLWQRNAIPRALEQTSPWLVLALMVTLGSVYAARVHGISNNFLSLGVYIPMVFLSAAVMATSDAPGRLLGTYFAIWVLAAATMAALVVVNFGRTRLYHEEIFLIVPVALFFTMWTRLGPWRWIPALAFLSIGVLSRKNTSHLVGLMTMAYFGLMVWLPRYKGNVRGHLRGAVRVYALLGMFAIASAGAAYVLANRHQYLPSGNPEYRMHTYRAAIHRFLESPVWGTAFSQSSSFKFTKYAVASSTQVLPVHSDILDILAHGGVIGLLLWVLGLWKNAEASWRHLLRPRLLDDRWAPFAHTLALSSLCAVAVYAFNPVLTAIPAVAYMLWTNLGLLIGLCVRRDLGEPPVPAR